MFPQLYHAHHNRHTEDLPFWLDLIRRQGGPALELGCGTGRVLLHLVQAGYPLYGLDIDRSMLDFLKSILPGDIRPAPVLIQADMSAFCLAARFPLIYLPCNTYSTLPPVVRQKTLDCVRRHLAAGGAFAASLPNPFLLEEMIEMAEPELEEVFPHPITGEPVEVRSAWEGTKQLVTVFWDYDILHPDGSVQQIRTSIQHQLTPTITYLEELLQAGFRDTDLYGDFDFSDYDPQSPYLIWVARQ